VAKGLDSSHNCSSVAPAISKAGFQVVCRYYSNSKKKLNPRCSYRVRARFVRPPLIQPVSVPFRDRADIAKHQQTPQGPIGAESPFMRSVRPAES
jgi:hypothetical protein